MNIDTWFVLLGQPSNSIAPYLTAIAPSSGALVSFVLYTFVMAKMKRYKGHCCGGGQQAIEVVVQAINPPQARQFLESSLSRLFQTLHL